MVFVLVVVVLVSLNSFMSVLVVCCVSVLGLLLRGLLRFCLNLLNRLLLLGLNVMLWVSLLLVMMKVFWSVLVLGSV